MCETGRKAPMNTKDLACNNGRNGETVECIDERLPYLDIAPPLTFVIEAIDPGYVCAFVIASEHEKVLRKFQLVAKE